MIHFRRRRTWILCSARGLSRKTKSGGTRPPAIRCRDSGERASMSQLQLFFRSRPWLAPVLLLLPFLFCGLAMIPYPGPHNDELFFSGPIYQPDAAWYTAEIGSARIPLMVMSYTGA